MTGRQTRRETGHGQAAAAGVKLVTLSEWSVSSEEGEGGSSAPTLVTVGKRASRGICMYGSGNIVGEGWSEETKADRVTLTLRKKVSIRQGGYTVLAKIYTVIILLHIVSRLMQYIM
ncbi:hypothetical protein AOLI_G00061770 [Acnodon oligacanthus]